MMGRMFGRTALRFESITGNGKKDAKMQEFRDIGRGGGMGDLN